MGRILEVTAAVAAIGLVAPLPAMAAGNFEFVVPAEAGLTLKVTGYAADGNVMFEATAARPEQRDGRGVYIVRIDENIVMSAPLARWCVEDSTARWSELAGHEGATGLCDDAPSETRGSYGFKAGSVLGAGTPAAAEESTAASRQSVAEAAACVQENLNILGFDAGPVDGQMGRRTFSAAAGFAGAQGGQAYPTLAEESAGLWCAKMTAAIAGGTARGPTDELARFRFGPDVDAGTARDTQEGLAEVDAYFRKVFGAALEQPGTIYVSSDADWLADAYVAHLETGAGIRRGKVGWFAGCHGGEAGYGFMFMCSKSDVFSGDWFGAGRSAQRAFALAHEYFHMLQYERAVGSLDGCCSGINTLQMLGPQWLVEGAAEYIAFRLLGDSKRMNFKREIEWHTLKAAEVNATLEKLQTREGYYAEPRAPSAGMIAAHLLAEETGLASLAEFYREIGSGKDWTSAFQATFGMHPEEFSRRYEEHIR